MRCKVFKWEFKDVWTRISPEDTPRNHDARRQLRTLQAHSVLRFEVVVRDSMQMEFCGTRHRNGSPEYLNKFFFAKLYRWDEDAGTYEECMPNLLNMPETGIPMSTTCNSREGKILFVDSEGFDWTLVKNTLTHTLNCGPFYFPPGLESGDYQLAFFTTTNDPCDMEEDYTPFTFFFFAEDFEGLGGSSRKGKQSAKPLAKYKELS